MWTKVRMFFRLVFTVSGEGRSIDYNRRYGKYRVVYKDGSVTHLMCFDAAIGYYDLYGAEIVKVIYKQVGPYEHDG